MQSLNSFYTFFLSFIVREKEGCHLIYNVDGQMSEVAQNEVITLDVFKMFDISTASANSTKQPEL